MGWVSSLGDPLGTEVYPWDVAGIPNLRIHRQEEESSSSNSSHLAEDGVLQHLCGWRNGQSGTLTSEGTLRPCTNVPLSEVAYQPAGLLAPCPPSFLGRLSDWEFCERWVCSLMGLPGLILLERPGLCVPPSSSAQGQWSVGYVRGGEW